MNTWVLAIALSLLALPARADGPVKKTAKAAGKTALNAVIDGGRTAGHTWTAFFHGGMDEAKSTAKAHGRVTGQHAKAGAQETKEAAKGL